MAEITELTNNTRLIDSVDIINGNFNNLNDGKQDAISDLDTIRNNASIGAGLATQVETNKSNIETLSSGKANKATTLAGYGITDAKIASGVITLGSNSITPLTSHQSLSSYDAISEKGTNYIRYASGLQICWGTSTVNLTLTATWGVLYESTSSPSYMNFPKSFSANPCVSISVCGWGGGFAFVEGVDVSTTGCRPAFLVRPVSTSAKNYNLAYIAIGRWK